MLDNFAFEEQFSFCISRDADLFIKLLSNDIFSLFHKLSDLIYNFYKTINEFYSKQDDKTNLIFFSEKHFKKKENLAKIKTRDLYGIKSEYTQDTLLIFGESIIKDFFGMLNYCGVFRYILYNLFYYINDNSNYIYKEELVGGGANDESALKVASGSMGTFISGFLISDAITYAISGNATAAIAGAASLTGAFALGILVVIGFEGLIYALGGYKGLYTKIDQLWDKIGEKWKVLKFSLQVLAAPFTLVLGIYVACRTIAVGIGFKLAQLCLVFKRWIVKLFTGKKKNKFFICKYI